MANLLDPSSKSEYQRYAQVFALEQFKPMMEQRFAQINVNAFCSTKEVTDAEAIMKRIDALVFYRVKNDAAAKQHQKVFLEIHRVKHQNLSHQATHNITKENQVVGYPFIE